MRMLERMDRIAQQEGFSAWSLLRRRFAAALPSMRLLDALAHGDMFLIGARPSHGKTIFGLQLLLDAARHGRRSVLFTLEYTRREAASMMASLNLTPLESEPEIVTSNDICANYIIQYLSGAPAGTIAVVDYLQILDQQRKTPPLSAQIRDLHAFARAEGHCLGFIAQIDRSFEAQNGDAPSIRDLRLPNPIPPDAFSKACFLHDGATRFQSLG
ncbi:MAG: DNA helicase [Pseudomonadota bacterium]